MILRKPVYFDSFRCIASSCPDSCCQEWDVDVDETSAAYYRSLPGALGDRLRSALHTEDGQTVMTIENGRCPMWRQDGLCRIQAELGEEALCEVCRSFPRLRHDYGDFLELGLELSCPEAARIILSGADGTLVESEVSGGEEPDYDGDAMEVLLRTRDNALELLNCSDPGKALASLLLYSYTAQWELDGEGISDFVPEAALESAKTHVEQADISDFLSFFRELEILTPRWEQLLSAPTPRPLGQSELSVARYLVNRYWLQAVSDYDLVCRVKFIVSSCLLTAALGGDPVQTAQLFSKEIENDSDNVDALLDAAYTHPAFTDARLLGMCLAK